jgi:hypothetical protein
MKKTPSLIDWNLLKSAMEKKAGPVADMAKQKLVETAEMAARAAHMADKLPDEHAWALDHVSTAHDDISEVHGFLRSMEDGEPIEVDVEPSGEMQAGFDDADGSGMQGSFSDENPNMSTSLEGQEGGRMMPSFDPEARVADSEAEVRTAAKKKGAKKKNKPTNPKLWSRAKAAAKNKFDVYPSAYANAYAVQWYNKRGGGWRKSGGNK